ncbi:MAG: class II aldolase/adducin family protein, partial [Candidatus Neomarinimicrobiota bacterium]
DPRLPDYTGSIMELRKWCRNLVSLSSTTHRAGDFPGNLSFRTADGFVITAAAANLAEIREEDFVEVKIVDVDQKRIYVKGSKEPSSESFIHDEVYQQSPPVQAIFHGHSDLMLAHYRALKLPVTKNEQPYGTIALMNEVLEALKDKNIIIMKNHGFIALGKTMDEVGQLIMEYHRRALKLNQAMRK